MTNYRLFLFNFLAVIWFLLSGFNKPADIDMSALETRKTEVELKLIEAENSNRKGLQTSQVKEKENIMAVNASPQKTTIKAIDGSSTDLKNATKGDDFEVPLDLSVSYKESENTDIQNEQKSSTQSRVTNIFATDAKIKPRSLELKGDFLMTPEPQAEKLKSLDGAGIIIKLNH